MKKLFKNIRALPCIVAGIGLLLGLNNAAIAGCHINVSVKNTGQYTLGVATTNDTAVKSKGGTWRALKKGHWKSKSFRVAPGNSVNGVYEAAFGCKRKRRYRIRYACVAGPQKSNSYSAYYPSADGWTTKTDLVIELPNCK